MNPPPNEPLQDLQAPTKQQDQPGLLHKCKHALSERCVHFINGDLLMKSKCYQSRANSGDGAFLQLNNDFPLTSNTQ